MEIGICGEFQAKAQIGAVLAQRWAVFAWPSNGRPEERRTLGGARHFLGVEDGFDLGVGDTAIRGHSTNCNSPDATLAQIDAATKPCPTCAKGPKCP